MEKAKITNVLGDVIMVPQWQLQKSAMEKFASEHYGEVVICDPGLVYDGRVAVVWRCRSCVQQLKVLGYFCFQVGFRDYPADFEYDVLVFVPFSHVTAQIAEAKVCFSEGRLQFLFFIKYGYVNRLFVKTAGFFVANLDKDATTDFSK